MMRRRMTVILRIQDGENDNDDDLRANQNKLCRKGDQEQLLGKSQFHQILKDLLGFTGVNVEDMR